MRYLTTSVEPCDQGGVILSFSTHKAIGASSVIHAVSADRILHKDVDAMQLAAR